MSGTEGQATSSGAGCAHAGPFAAKVLLEFRLAAARRFVPGPPFTFPGDRDQVWSSLGFSFQQAGLDLGYQSMYPRGHRAVDVRGWGFRFLHPVERHVNNNEA